METIIGILKDRLDNPLTDSEHKLEIISLFQRMLKHIKRTKKGKGGDIMELIDEMRVLVEHEE